MAANRPGRSLTADARRRGSAVIECALVMTVAVPLLFGVTSIGIRLGRTVQATQLTRDVAHMYALGTDFSLATTQSITGILGRDFDLSSSGNSVLILSRVVKVYQADCTAGGMPNCANVNQTVFAQRIVIGNSSLRASAFGTPPAQYINTQGNVASSDYYQQSSLVAAGFDSVLSLQQGQNAYVVEGYFPMPDLSFLTAGGAPGAGAYVRFVF